MSIDNLHPVMGQMPADWRIVRIDTLFAIQQGKQVSARHRAGDRQRPFLRTKNVYWGRLDLTELDAMHFSGEDEQRLRLLPGDLLTCEGGWVGRTAMWNGEVSNCLYQNHLHRLRPLSADTDPLFALYWLWYAFDIGEVYFGRQNVTTIPNLSKSRLAELPMPTPSREEQRQIAAILSAVQRAIERQERLIALTIELKNALMHKLFAEGTRGEAQKQSEIGPVPKSWVVAPVRQLCDLLSGGTPSKVKMSFWNGTIPWASPKDMKLSRLTDTQDHLSQACVDDGIRLVPPGSLFVVIRGMILMRDVPIALATVPMAFNQDMKALVNLRGVTSDFMLFSLQNARERLLSKVGSSAHGTRTLMTSAVEELLIAVPTSAEQRLVSEALRSVENKAANHHRLRSSLQALFCALLDRLVTGQIRVNNIELFELRFVEQQQMGAM